MLLSSERRLYVLLVGTRFDGSGLAFSRGSILFKLLMLFFRLIMTAGVPMLNIAGTIISMLGCHKIEDVREVLVGMGLQVLRLVI